MTDLAAAETQALAEHEAVIERGLNTFVEVGSALLSIRERRLYRAEYSTFEDYCRERWGFSDGRARQLIGAAQTVTNVTVAGLPAPSNEAQARELAKVPEEQREDVWRETVERTDGKPTAAAVRETHQPEPESKAPPITDDELAELRINSPKSTRPDMVSDDQLAELNGGVSASATLQPERRERTDVVKTINQALVRAEEAAERADHIRKEHLSNRSEEAAVWHRRLSAALEQLQRLNTSLQEATS